MCTLDCLYQVIAPKDLPSPKKANEGPPATRAAPHERDFPNEPGVRVSPSRTILEHPSLEDRFSSIYGKPKPEDQGALGILTGWCS